jgi:hypothetical protein
MYKFEIGAEVLCEFRRAKKGHFGAGQFACLCYFRIIG